MPKDALEIALATCAIEFRANNCRLLRSSDDDGPCPDDVLAACDALDAATAAVLLDAATAALLDVFCDFRLKIARFTNSGDASPEGIAAARDAAGASIFAALTEALEEKRLVRPAKAGT